MTLTQAKRLRIGDVLYHTINRNADGTPQRWRVSGKVKLWKRSPNRVQVPIKNGLRNCDYLVESTLRLLNLA